MISSMWRKTLYWQERKVGKQAVTFMDRTQTKGVEETTGRSASSRRPKEETRQSDECTVTLPSPARPVCGNGGGGGVMRRPCVTDR